jgi:TolA-binding protein
MIVGEAKKAQGDLSGARDAFGAALRPFDEQYPKSYESPEYLVYKFGMLQERLGRREAETPR